MRPLWHRRRINSARWGALGVGLGLGIGIPDPPVAAADTPLLEIAWTAPSEVCPSGAWVKSQVLRMVGAQPLARSLLVRATVGFVDEEWILRLATPEGEREIRGSTCQEVADAAAVSLALALSPGGKLEGPTESSERRVNPLAVPPEVPVSPAPEQAASTASPIPASGEPSVPARLEALRKKLRRPLILQLALETGVSLGIMPRVAPELALDAGVSLGAWSFRSVGHWIPPSDYEARDRAPAGARLSLLEVDGLGCWGPYSELSVCLGLAGSRIQGHGYGITDPSPNPGSFSWLSAAGQVSGEAKLNRHVGLRGTLQGLVPVTRPRAYLENVGTVAQPAPLGIRITFGLVLAFP